MPVCAQPDLSAPVYTACLSNGRYPVISQLTDLAIDQLLKGDGAPLSRDLHAIFVAAANKDFVEANRPLADYVAHLGSIELRRLDTSSGTLQLDVAEADRKFSAPIFIRNSSYDLSLELSARIEGGYWRTPAVLQVAFWKGQRPSFRVGKGDDVAVTAEIECLVVAVDGIRIVTAGQQTPDVLVRFDSCE